MVYVCPTREGGGDVRRELEWWFGRLRPGGVMAGDCYVEGTWRDGTRGIKAIVDDFAAGQRLQVRVTFDTPPTWFVVKPPAQATVARQDVALLTAYDSNQQDLATYTTPNKSAYCGRHGYRFIVRTDGFAPSRPPAWSKIRFIKECLKEHEWVFWSDADSLVMNGSTRLEEFIDPNYDLILTHDDFGHGAYNVCTGQMFVRHSKWSMRFLDEVWSQRQFLHDRLWENRAVIHLLWNRDLSRNVQMVSQRRFNSYPRNYRDGDFIVHAAGMRADERLPLIRHFASLARV
ncbi:MAG TPA: DUF273 domain-containing protein [Tepidisphaeraceae bacterium]|nr:DUF273 domain-containing protein [Tepidisphaeraceae bacterium]